MFQLASPVQQDLVGRLQPRDVQDVVADISLFRPGPVLFPLRLCSVQVVSHSDIQLAAVLSRLSGSWVALAAGRVHRFGRPGFRSPVLGLKQLLQVNAGAVEMDVDGARSNTEMAANLICLKASCRKQQN